MNIGLVQGSNYSALITKTVGEEKIANIKSFPDLGSPPDKGDSTTLSDEQRTYVAGVRDLDDFDFPANYSKSDFLDIKALVGQELELRVRIGETNASPEYSEFTFNGTVDVTKSGGEVNGVQEMTVSVYPSTEITLES